MADDECRLLRKTIKVGKGKEARSKVYYKCDKKKCDKECVISVLWESIEETGLDGKKYSKGQRVIEVDCECTKYFGPPQKPFSPTDECEVDVASLEDVKKGDKTYRKSLVRCRKSDKCRKECVFYILYKDEDKELGEIEKIDCECVNWDKL